MGRARSPSSPASNSSRQPRFSRVGAVTTFSGSSGSSVVVEVRDHVCVHTDGAVTRHELERYVEELNLNFSAAMTTQVVLAVLGLDVGGDHCNATRFARTLCTP